MDFTEIKVVKAAYQERKVRSLVIPLMTAPTFPLEPFLGILIKITELEISSL